MKDGEFLVAARRGGVHTLRTAFSPGFDLVREVGRGSQNGQASFLRTGVVPAGTPANELSGALEVFHFCGDDVAPWKTNGTYIGANHGASEVVRAAVPGHGLGDQAIGGAWRDAEGFVFRLLKIEDGDTVLFLSENSGVHPKWRFRQEIAGGRLTAMDGAVLDIRGQRVTQLWPSLQIGLQCSSAGGEALEDGEERRCGTFEIAEEYDIVAPDAVARALAHHRGGPFDPAAAGGEAILANRIRYRFFPDGNCIVHHSASALRDLDFEFMGFLQSAPLEPRAGEFVAYCIPGTRPFVQDGTGFDFRSGQRMPELLASPLHFTADSERVEDPTRLPDRVIQFLEDEPGRRRVGLELGYLREAGLGVPEIRAASTDLALFIYLTGKIYPVAINRRAGPIRAGHQFECAYFRRYFVPGPSRAVGGSGPV